MVLGANLLGFRPGRHHKFNICSAYHPYHTARFMKQLRKIGARAEGTLHFRSMPMKTVQELQNVRQPKEGFDQCSKFGSNRPDKCSNMKYKTC